MHLFLYAGFLIVSFAVAVCCWLIWQILHQNGRILQRLEALEEQLENSETVGAGQPEDLPMESPAPGFELLDLTGTQRTLSEFVGQRLLLIFFNPACGFCRDFAPQLARATLDCSLRLLLISTGSREENQRFFAETGLSGTTLLQQGMETAAAYKIAGTPGGYLISAEGRIASPMTMGADPLLALITEQEKTGNRESKAAVETQEQRAMRFSSRSLARSKINRDGLKAGTPAPDFRLPRVDDQGEMTLAQLRGRPVLLVFSSPNCGPCNELAPTIEKFHRKHADLHVVTVSRGEAAENLEKMEKHGITHPVVLQKHWEISKDYAIFHTPAAYLIDALGVITSDVAVGIDAIGELMPRALQLLRQSSRTQKLPLFKRLARLPVSIAAATLQRLHSATTVTKSKIELLELKHFRFVPRPDDIFIVTYPRSGTTWMQMILYQLTTDGSMEISHIAEHSPWFERSAESDRGYEERRSPRVFKTHLSYSKIPKGPGRYIYIARDGRDVAVSYYNLYCSHNGYKGTFDEFFELFMRGRVMFGSWFEHVGSWWQHRHNLSVLFLTYEELISDLDASLRRIIAFCHLNIPPERLPLILDRCSFAFMKQHEDKFDPAVEDLWQHGARLNRFLRAGKMGEGSIRLSRQQQTRFDTEFRAHSERVSSIWSAAVPPMPRFRAAGVGAG